MPENFNKKYHNLLRYILQKQTLHSPGEKTEPTISDSELKLGE